MKRFFPGFEWRILAHKRTGRNTKGVHTGESLDLDAGIDRKSNGYPGIRTQLSGDWEFDELVIDHWFHLEQMGDRDWWIGIGDPGKGDYYHVRIHIAADKTVEISIEDESNQEAE